MSALLDPNHKRNSNMSNLPLEIWFEIGSQNYINHKDLLSLIRVNRFLYRAFIPKLYANVCIRLPSWTDLCNTPSTTSKFSSAGPAVETLLDRLDSDTQLRTHVREFRVKGTRHVNIYPDDNTSKHQYDFIASLMTLIGELPNLKSIRLGSFMCHAKWIVYLATRPSLHLNITTLVCKTYGEAVDSEPYTALTLRACRMSGNDQFLKLIAFGGSLQNLELPSYSTRRLLNLYASSGRPVLASLRSLEIYNFHPDLVELFRNTLGLTRLQFTHRNSIRVPNPEGWRDIIPKLESFCGHEQLIPLFIIGRPIRYLETWDVREEGPAFRSLEKHFGSITPLHTIIFEFCGGFEEKIEYLTTTCPQVRKLSIRSRYYRYLTKEQLTNSLLKISKLKNLRELAFLDSQLETPHDSAWKNKYCEDLKAKGCDDLVEINFGGQIWTRDSNGLLWKY